MKNRTILVVGTPDIASRISDSMANIADVKTVTKEHFEITAHKIEAITPTLFYPTKKDFQKEGTIFKSGGKKQKNKYPRR